ncbi:MAG: hypothetical protein FJ115_14910 [Deltaproteobacteria bacterium]|nr:hypothetical protein [Deltaproteobacteria bacterium]
MKDVQLDRVEPELKKVRCFRCGRMMVFEKFYGLQEHFFGWRCIYCGEIVDQVILENRFERKH